MELIGQYQGLLEFIPQTHTNAICEPVGERLPLTHHQLRGFLTHDFDLSKFDIPCGARVAILLPNGPELALCVISVVSKWCAAPINPTNTWEEIKSELESSRACAIIILAGSSNDACLKAANALNLGVLVLNPSGSVTGIFRLVSLVPVNPSSPLQGYTTAKTVEGFKAFHHPETVLLLHTSGTSGTKKLVPYSLDMLISGIGSIVCSWEMKPSDVCLNMMPLFHIGGIVRNIFSPILSGGSVISCPGFDPILFWNVLSKQRVTWYYAAPTMHHAILMEAEKRDKPLPVADIRFIANAAGGLLPVLATSLKNTFGAVILTSYGMTECMPISSPPQTYDLDPSGTSGMPVGPDVLIVDDNQVPLPPMKPGNIFVRGPPCFGGYENSSTATDESFFVVNGEPGWFNTGDMGYLDENSYLFISGRSKEIINRGGETISPFEIEEAVVQHPLVKETLAFCAPHETFQETIGVVIVSKPDMPRVDLPTLWKYLEDKLHRSKWPQLIIYMNALPKNAAGKILRIKLGDRLQLSSVDEESAPVTRLLEGVCPPLGAPLTQKIEAHHIVVNLNFIEDFLTSREGVKVQKAVLVEVDLPFKPRSLVAFVVTDQGSSDELESHCNKGLNKYETPLFIHTMEEIPELQTQPGEVDRALLVDLAQRLYLERNIIRPRDHMEVKIEKIWRQFLGAGSVVSVADSFFDLGGDSLKAGQLVNAMRKKLKIQLSVADLFTAPTIEAMARKLSKLKIIGSPNLSAKVLRESPTQKLNGESPLVGVVSPSDDVELKYGGSYEYSMNLSSTAFPCLFLQLIPLCNEYLS
jgi:acyl-CoA synthetase (AMP-forming)/AMP-acid ligase II/acyl carrier protein